MPYRKIVVTDDQGRFLVPDLPDASYELWVRGYGLKDSARVKAARGERVRLQVANAPSPQEAASIYPASYWTSLIHPPSKDQLPKEYSSQEHWLAALRGGCNQCHQLGMTATRRYPNPGDWDAIVQRNTGMNGAADRLGRQLLETTLADWATRIKAGRSAARAAASAGIERNFVVSQWDWGAPESFIHDVTSTDKRNPTLYPNGRVYGADRTGGGRLWVLDPVKNTVEGIQVQPRNPKGYTTKGDYYHGPETPEEWMASPHNPMLDEHGRVWLTEPIRPVGAANNPKWSASTIATDTNDPAEHRRGLQDAAFTQPSACSSASSTRRRASSSASTRPTTPHHLQFDWQGRIWTDGDVLGMLDTTKLDPNNPEGTEAAAQKAWMRIDMNTRTSHSDYRVRNGRQPGRRHRVAIGSACRWTAEQAVQARPEDAEVHGLSAAASGTTLARHRLQHGRERLVLGRERSPRTPGSAKPANSRTGICRARSSPARAGKPAAPSTRIFCGSINSTRSGLARTRSSSPGPRRIRC